MKIVVCVVGALVAGVALGVAGTWAEFRGVQVRFEPHNGQVDLVFRDLVIKNENEMLPETKGARVEVVNGEKYDFGQMERTGKLSHDFILKNVGTAMLRLDKGGTSCEACTIAELEKNELQPGETTKVSVNWTAFQMEPDFHKEAYIRTSDPERRILRLIIEGKVVVTMRMEPLELKLKDIAVGDATTSQVRFWLFTDEPPEFQSPEFAEADTAEFFEVTLTPISGEQLGKSQGAKSGMVMTVNVKPGLPLGAITQTIRLKTNVKGMEQIELPITGKVLGDLTFIGGKNFYPNTGTLSLGAVKQNAGTKATLHIRVQGPHRRDVQLKVGSVEPEDVLKVSIGEPKEPNGGVVIIYPLTIEVPPGSRAVVRDGGQDNSYGRVMIETTHPDSKELPLKVSFWVLD